MQEAPAPRAASKLRPDRVAREPAPESKAASIEDSMPSAGKSSPLAAPRAAVGPQHRGPQNQRVADDADDFGLGDTDVSQLLG